MDIEILTNEQYIKKQLISLPKKGKSLLASDDGITWCNVYYVDIDARNINAPFICVEKSGDIDYPYSRGVHWKQLKLIEYTIEDVVLINGNLHTIDGLYKTYKEHYTGHSYWHQTSEGKTRGANFIWNHKGFDYIDASVNGVENSIKILNKLK